MLVSPAIAFAGGVSTSLSISLLFFELEPEPVPSADDERRSVFGPPWFVRPCSSSSPSPPRDFFLVPVMLDSLLRLRRSGMLYVDYARFVRLLISSFFYFLILVYFMGKKKKNWVRCAFLFFPSLRSHYPSTTWELVGQIIYVLDHTSEVGLRYMSYRSGKMTSFCRGMG